MKIHETTETTDGNGHGRAYWEDKPVRELRQEVSARGIAAGRKVHDARKEVLVQALIDGEWPGSEGGEHRRHMLHIQRLT